jgi:uncharacterized membrane protein YoaK (UPF0700 family)
VRNKINIAAIISVILTIGFVRFFGIENVPYQLSIILLTISIILIILGVMKENYGSSKYRHRIKLVVVLFSILFILIIMLLTIQKYMPMLVKTYEIPLGVLILIILVILLISIWIAVIAKYKQD